MSDSLRPHESQHAKASLSITNSQSSLRLMSIESVMPSDHLILCPPLLLPLIFPSIRVFSSESVLLIRWPKYIHTYVFPSLHLFLQSLHNNIKTFLSYLFIYPLFYLFLLSFHGWFRITPKRNFHPGKESVMRYKSKILQKYEYLSF